MTTGANMRSFNHMSYHSHLTDWKSTRLVAKPHTHLFSMQSLLLKFYNTIIDCRLGTFPCISKTNRKHGAAPLPKPPTTSPPQSTKCILDTELYMKVVQKEVANVSNPIARIVPSTVAVTSGTALRFWFSWFFHGVEHENIKPGNLDFPLCAKNYPWKAGTSKKGLFRSLGGLLPVSHKVVVVKNKGNKSLKSPKNRHQRIYRKTIRIFCKTTITLETLRSFYTTKTNMDSKMMVWKNAFSFKSGHFWYLCWIKKKRYIQKKTYGKTMVVKPLEANSPVKPEPVSQTPEACETWKISLIS